MPAWLVAKLIFAHHAQADGEMVPALDLRCGCRLSCAPHLTFDDLVRRLNASRRGESLLPQACESVSEASGADWRYIRINQTEFDSPQANTLGKLIDGLQS